MNIRKPMDYGTMYRELTAILTQNLSQMDEVYAIGNGRRKNCWTFSAAAVNRIRKQIRKTLLCVFLRAVV